MQQNYQPQQQQQPQQIKQQHLNSPIKEKQPRQSRSSLRASRLNQHQQAQQQEAYQQQLTYQVSQQNYTAMDVQSSAMDTNQVQIALTQPNVQSLMPQRQSSQQQQQQQPSFVAPEPPQQKLLKQNLMSKPYVKNSSQGYKFPPPPATFDIQSCKFTTNNLKVRLDLILFKLSKNRISRYFYTKSVFLPDIFLVFRNVRNILRINSCKLFGILISASPQRLT